MNFSIERQRWVLKYMPIIVQTKQDKDEGFGLFAVFYHYIKEQNTLEFHYIFKVRL